MTQLLQIAPDKLPEAWPHLQLHLDMIAASSRGKVTAGDLAQLCAAGQMQLWAVLDEEGRLQATCLTEFAFYPRQKICRVVAVVGHGLDMWLHHLSQIEDWARAQGCQAMQNIARKGYAKKLSDYKLTHVLLEKPL